MVIIRHAKSSWDNPGLDDYERPLNKRGLRSAPVMASVLAKLISKPDLIISSYAARAHTTAEFFAEEFDYDKDNIQIEEQLYMCSPQTILDLLKSLDNNFNTVLLFGHNPELTSFCNKINNHSIDNMPTCGMYGMKFETDKWSEINFGKGKFEFFEYPKKYIK